MTRGSNRLHSLDAQIRCLAVLYPQPAHADWTLIPSNTLMGITGGNTDRPALQQLFVTTPSKVDVIVVYRSTG